MTTKDTKLHECRRGRTEELVRLSPEEKELVGSGIVPDEVDVRIQRLVSNHLQRLGSANGGWDVLFRDPQDGRLWEMTFPHSEMHGGGPRSLREIVESCPAEVSD